MTYDRYAPKLHALVEAILHEPGTLDPSVREVVVSGEEVPDALVPYVEKITNYAYKVTDRDIERLRQAGYTDDQIFELTVSAALGAGLLRLNCGLRALHEAS